MWHNSHQHYVTLEKKAALRVVTLPSVVLSAQRRNVAVLKVIPLLSSVIEPQVAAHTAE
jgi:hypothetical protein